MPSNASERRPGKVSTPRTVADIEAFFTNVILNDPEYIEGVQLEARDRATTELGDGMVDPNPARQERLYLSAHENAGIDVGQLPTPLITS
jgi:hypothetical protein